MLNTPKTPAEQQQSALNAAVSGSFVTVSRFFQPLFKVTVRLFLGTCVLLVSHQYLAWNETYHFY